MDLGQSFNGKVPWTGQHEERKGQVERSSSPHCSITVVSKLHRASLLVHEPAKRAVLPRRSNSQLPLNRLRRLLPQHPRNLSPHAARELLPVLSIKVAPLAPAKHGELLAPPALRPDLRPRDDMIVHVRHDLRGGGAVVLHDVPVVHARGPAQRRGQHTQVVTQLAGLVGRGPR